MWGRLLWKDAREIVPVWITLILAAVLCLSVSLWMVNSNIAHIAPLYISGHTFIALISVITGVFLLASEDENRTLHLLRNLPLPPKQIVWQKVALGSVGVIVMACLIAGVTMWLATCAQSKPLEAESSYHFTLANVTLLPLLYLVIAAVSSTVFRSHFYGVLIAGAICAGVIAVLEPSWLGARESDLLGRSQIRWLWVAITVITGVCALVLGAGRWVEEKFTIGKLTKNPSADFSSANALAGISKTESGELSTNPFAPLLWQSFRQVRTPLICFFVLVILGWIAIPIGLYYGNSNKFVAADEFAIPETFMTLFWVMAVMIAFASTIFLDDKRQGNFLFFQQNRERSRWFWLSRLLPFWSMALLLTLAWNFFVFDLGSDFLELPQNRWYFDHRQIEVRNSMALQAASQSFLVPFLLLLGIIGIGQYFSMFVRNPILSFVFTGVVSVIFAGLVGYVVFVNESVWLFIVPIVAAGYVATWWRSKSWLATSPQKNQYLMPIVLPMILFVIVTAAFINTRANKFSNVRFDPSNFADWNYGALLYVEDQHSSNIGLQRVEFGTEAQRQQAAKLYRDAIALYKEGDHSLMDHTSPMPWPAQKTADFVSKHQVAIDKIIEASLLPACAPFLSENPETRGSERWSLEQLALVNSHHQLLESNLPAAKLSIDAYDRVTQRAGDGLSISRYESGYFGLLIAWADHPDQKLDAIKTAIALLEGSNSDIRPTKIVNSMGSVVEPDSETGMYVSRLFRQFGGEREFMNLQSEIASLQDDDNNHRISEHSHNYRLLPWEYQRQLKVCQLRAIREFDLDLAIINSYSIGNDQSLDNETIFRNVTATRYGPHIPIEEDRVGFTNLYYSRASTLEDAHWRRYTLIRMGLAAYMIEKEQYPGDLYPLEDFYEYGLPITSNGQMFGWCYTLIRKGLAAAKIKQGQYPDDLRQLENFYEYGLPMTTDGHMFGWIKEGLGADLIEAVYKDVDSDELVSAEKIADRSEPLLLPLPIVSSNQLPKPIDYEEGRLGIDLKELSANSHYYMQCYDHFTYYKFDLAVGAETELSD